MATLKVAIDARQARVGGQQATDSIVSIVNAAEKGRTGTDRFQLALTRSGVAAKHTAKEMREAAASNQVFERSTTGASRGLSLLTRSFLGLFGGVSVALVLRQTSAAFSQFEQTLATVKGVSRASAEEFKALNAVALDLGATTKFTATQAGEGLLFLSRAGFTARQSIEALPATLDLAAAGNIELGESADYASNILSQFRLEAAETSRVVDTLIATSNRSNTDVRQLAEAMKFAGPVAGALGKSVEETAAAIGVLGDSGIQGAMAGTNLRMILVRLLDPVNEAREAITRLGLTVEDLDPTTNTLVDIFQKLHDVEMDAASATEIFSARNAAAAIQLAAGVDKVRELASANQMAAGEAAEMSRIMSETTAGSLKNFISSVEALQLRVGRGGLGGAWRWTLDTMTGAFRILAGMEDSIDRNVTAANLLAQSLKFLGVAGAVTGFIMLAGAVTKVTVALGFLRTALNSHPVFLIASMIGLATSAVVMFVQSLRDADGGLQQMEEQINKASDALDRYQRALQTAARARSAGNVAAEVESYESQKKAVDDLITSLQDLQSSGRRELQVSLTEPSFYAGEDDVTRRHKSYELLEAARSMGVNVDTRQKERTRKVEGLRALDPTAPKVENITVEYVNLQDLIDGLTKRSDQLSDSTKESSTRLAEQRDTAMSAERAIKMLDSQMRALTSQQNELNAAIGGIVNNMEDEAVRRQQVTARVKEYGEAAGLSAEQIQANVDAANKELDAIESLEQTRDAAIARREAEVEVAKQQAAESQKARQALPDMIREYERQIDILGQDEAVRESLTAKMKVQQLASTALAGATADETEAIKAQIEQLNALIDTTQSLNRAEAGRKSLADLELNLRSENMALKSPDESSQTVRVRLKAEQILDESGLSNTDEGIEALERINQLLAENERLKPQARSDRSRLTDLREELTYRESLNGLDEEQIQLQNALREVRRAAATDNIELSDSEADALARRLIQQEKYEESLKSSGRKSHIELMKEEMEWRRSLLGMTDDQIEKEERLRAIREAAAASRIDLSDSQVESMARELEMLDNIENQYEAINRVAEASGSAASDAFYDLATGAKSAEDALLSLGDAILRAIYNETVGAWISQAVGGFVRSIGGSLGGGAASAGTRVDASGATWAPAPIKGFASGGAFDGGGIVDGSRYFSIGEMGEDGPEAVMPLTRDRQGRLGVHAAGSGETGRSQVAVQIASPVQITVQNTAANDVSVKAESRTGNDGETQILLRIEKHMAKTVRQRGPLAQAIEQTYGVGRGGRQV